MMDENDPLDAKSLDLPPSRELSEAAALLAYAAPERRPPERLKSRILSSLHASESPSRFKQWAAPATAAVAAIALAAVFLLRTPDDGASLAAVSGEVTIDGRAASAGAAIGPDSVIAVSADGEAVVRVAGRAGFSLTRGGRASLIRGENGAVVVKLSDGWLLSAVKTGAAYSVETAHSRVSALGTDFIVKARDERAYVCICRGRIALEGDFTETTLASEHHGAASEPLYRSGPEAGMEGHSDEDIVRLRTLTGLNR